MSVAVPHFPPVGSISSSSTSLTVPISLQFGCAPFSTAALCRHAPHSAAACARGRLHRRGCRSCSGRVGSCAWRPRTTRGMCGRSSAGDAARCSSRLGRSPREWGLSASPWRGGKGRVRA
eukprot:scaffold19029_cov119-Isochrysis_galbana.AAC.10